MITITLPDITRRFAAVEEAVPFVRELSKVERARHVDHRDARLALGAALNQIRGQISHGQWTSFIGNLGVHLRTAQAAMQMAARFCDEHGRLIADRVIDAIREHKAHGNVRIERIEPLSAGIRQLGMLAAAPRMRPETRNGVAPLDGVTPLTNDETRNAVAPFEPGSGEDWDGPPKVDGVDVSVGELDELEGDPEPVPAQRPTKPRQLELAAEYELVASTRTLMDQVAAGLAGDEDRRHAFTTATERYRHELQEIRAGRLGAYGVPGEGR